MKVYQICSRALDEAPSYHYDGDAFASYEEACKAYRQVQIDDYNAFVKYQTVFGPRYMDEKQLFEQCQHRSEYYELYIAEITVR